MNNNPMAIGTPMQRLIGVLVFLFPFLSLITPSGIGFSSIVFVLAALIVPRKAWQALRPRTSAATSGAARARGRQP